MCVRCNSVFAGQALKGGYNHVELQQTNMHATHCPDANSTALSDGADKLCLIHSKEYKREGELRCFRYTYIEHVIGSSSPHGE